MKSLAIALSLVAFVWFTAAAQRDRGSLFVGAGIAHFSVQSVTAPYGMAAFQKTFSDPILLEFNGSYARHQRPDSAATEVTLESFSVALLGLYRIRLNEQQHAKLGAGISGRFFNEHWKVEADRSIPTSAFKPGLTIAGMYDLLFGQWILGLRGSLERFGKNNSVYAAALQIAYQF